MNLADKIEQGSTPVTESGCHLWLKAVSGVGYGQVCHGGKVLYAHRVAYEAAHGPIPSGLVVRHKCDTKLCCNPDHLVVGTVKQNSEDARQRGLLASCERNGRSKLNAQDIAAIRADTRSYPEIATTYGVDRSAISLIKTGKRWGDLK